MQRPAKPHPDYPLFANQNGQWTKKVKGKAYYFGKWADDPKGERALRDWLDRKDNILAGLDHVREAESAGGLTLGELMGQFVKACQVRVKEGTMALPTLSGYLTELPPFVDFFGGSVAVADLRPGDFAKYRAEAMVGKRSLGPDSVKRTIAYIKRMFNWASGNGKITKMQFGDDFKGPDTGKAAKRKYKLRMGIADYSDRIVTGAEIDTLVAAASPLWRAMILVSVNCGLGPADLGRVQWQHIDLEKRRFIMPRGKTGVARNVALWKKTAAALRRLLYAPKGEHYIKHVRAAFDKEGQQAHVFITKRGQPVYRALATTAPDGSPDVTIHNAVSGTFIRMAKTAGMVGVSQYRLRHTFRTLAAKAKDTDAINFAMGHEDRSTGKTYDHEGVSWSRVRRLSKVVYRRLWPKAKITSPAGDTTVQAGQLRLAV